MVQYFVMGDWTVRGECTEVEYVLHCGGTGGAPLRYGVVGRVTMDREDSGRVSPQGDVAADGEDSTAEQGLDVYITPPGRGDSGGGISRDA